MKKEWKLYNQIIDGLDLIRDNTNNNVVNEIRKDINELMRINEKMS